MKTKMNLAEVKAALVGIKVHYEFIRAGKQQLALLEDMIAFVSSLDIRLSTARSLLNSWKNGDSERTGLQLRNETDEWLWSEETLQ